MLKINEYDLNNLRQDLEISIRQIDTEIINDLNKISKINGYESFFIDLQEVVDNNNDFSFIKASQNIIEKLKKIDTTKNIVAIKPFIKKLNLPKKYSQKKGGNNFKLNNIIEYIFGYHITKRTQVLKKTLQYCNIQNCAYCLAQYTTAYGCQNKSIFIKGNLDHIYPKSINALISLSINNLVPVCSHCNQRKLDADLSKFNFNPFNSNDNPTFIFKNVLKIQNGIIRYNNLNDLDIHYINQSLKKRLELNILYKEYESPIINLLERYNKFNSTSYKEYIDNLLGAGISHSLEYFITEMPYSEGNIQNIPLHKFKSDFYKELENYKKSGKVKFY